MDANSFALLQTEVVGDAQHIDDGDRHTGQQRAQNGLVVNARLPLQNGDNAGRRTAPRQQVHNGVHQDQENAQIHHPQIQLFIQRNKGCAADQRGRRAVAVQGDAGCHDAGSHQDLQRVALGKFDHKLGNGIKQAGIQHDRKIQDGKQQHDAGLSRLGNAGHRPVANNGDLVPQRNGGGFDLIRRCDHFAVFTQKRADKGKNERHQNKRGKWLHFLGHDQTEEYDDHDPCKDRHSHRGLPPYNF